MKLAKKITGQRIYIQFGSWEWAELKSGHPYFNSKKSKNALAKRAKRKERNLAFSQIKREIDEYVSSH